MLGGIDPILIFAFKKLIPGFLEPATNIPVAAGEPTLFGLVPLPFLPIYLSERLFGIYVESESKAVDIDTEIDTTSKGDSPKYFQKGMGSTVKIEMVANKDSIGIALINALIDQIFPKVTSYEYSVTYLNGATTLFSGILHSYSVTQDSNSTLYRISLELMKPSAGSLTKVVEAAPVVKSTLTNSISFNRSVVQ